MHSCVSISIDTPACESGGNKNIYIFTVYTTESLKLISKRGVEIQTNIKLKYSTNSRCISKQSMVLEYLVTFHH